MVRVDDETKLVLVLELLEEIVAEYVGVEDELDGEMELTGEEVVTSREEEVDEGFGPGAVANR
jgi:hypothetical protein